MSRQNGPHSDIHNDPNRPADPQHVLRLIAKAIAVSLETVKIPERLPELPELGE